MEQTNLALHSKDPLYMWVIYERPKDYPKGYVVRCWRVKCRQTKALYAGSETTDTLEQARKLLPPGSVRLPRLPDDQPPIKEVWM